MPGSVPTAPSAPGLGIPTTGAAAQSKELFTVLLDRGQDFIARAIAALDGMRTLPSQIVPRTPTVNWIDPSFIRPTPLAGFRPAAPALLGFARPVPLVGARPGSVELGVAPPVFTRPAATTGGRPNAPDIAVTWPTFSRPPATARGRPDVPDVTYTWPTFTRPAPTAGAKPAAPTIPIEAAQRIIFDWLADPDPTVRRAYEAAVFSRASDRAIAEARRITDEAASRWAAAGFSIPPGMLSAQIDYARTKASGVVAQASFEAMTRSQDLQLEKYKLCIQTGLSALLDVFRTTTSTYVAERNADSQSLQTEAQVYSSRVQAQAAQVQSILGRYTAESNVYVAERNADSQSLQTEAQIYSSIVQANSAKIQAVLGEYSTRASVYTADREADTRALQTEAQVYSSGVQAYNAQAQTILAKYTAESGAYIAERNADAQDLQTAAQVFTAQSKSAVDAYQAEASAYVAERNVDVQMLQTEGQVYSAKVQALAQRVTTELKATEIENNVLLANLQLLQKAMGEIAQSYSQLAAGATAALHASVGFEDRAQYSNSQSTDWRVDWRFDASY